MQRGVYRPVIRAERQKRPSIKYGELQAAISPIALTIDLFRYPANSYRALQSRHKHGKKDKK
jgi:hypothetical protein